MADEVQVQSTVQIKKNNVNYRNTTTAFKDDITGTEKGPVPGAITATTAGNDVDLSQLTVPGYCVITNQGNQIVHYGLHDGSNFFPIGMVRPGKLNVISFSSLFGNVLADTGTGDVGNTTFRVLAENQDTNILVEAFES